MMEKGNIAQRRRKIRHNATAWKKKTQYSSVERVDMAQRGKRVHGAAAYAWKCSHSAAEWKKVGLAQQRLKSSHGETA